MTSTMIWYAPVPLPLHLFDFQEDATNHQLLHRPALAVDWDQHHRWYQGIGDNLTFDCMQHWSLLMLFPSSIGGERRLLLQPSIIQEVIDSHFALVLASLRNRTSPVRASIFASIFRSALPVSRKSLGHEKLRSG